MNDNAPRFRTAHDAGKYIAAQLYDYARGISPEEFGAIPRYIENPAWTKARFAVIPINSSQLGEFGIFEEKGEPEKPAKTADERKGNLRTPNEWYQTCGMTIVIAADVPEYEEFSEWWNFAKITNTAFAEYLGRCTLLD